MMAPVVAFVVVQEDEVVDDILAFSSTEKADAYVEWRVRIDERAGEADRRSYGRFLRKLDDALVSR